MSKIPTKHTYTLICVLPTSCLPFDPLSNISHSTHFLGTKHPQQFTKAEVPTCQKDAHAGGRGCFTLGAGYWVSENIIAHLGGSNFLITVLWGVGGIKAVSCLKGT